jgi:beta-galactosidase
MGRLGLGLVAARTKLQQPPGSCNEPKAPPHTPLVADFAERRKHAGAKVRAVSVHNSSPEGAFDPTHGESSATGSTGRADSSQRARLTREGVQLGDQLVPLLSGSAHYFRLEPDSWRPCLEAMREMGCTVVDVYVPWSVHEAADGTLDFGEKNPQLDVVRFLRIAEEVGLYALVRPGPHINAELSGFGLPERVLWDRDCQARSPAGEPVILPMPPQAFPVPSYASHKLLHEACEWLRRAAAVLGPLTWPAGPIVLCQIDNEGALYFRDGVYEQDYHPDSIAAFERFLEARYASPTRLGQAYGISADNFQILPPRRFDAKDAPGLLRHLDWAEYQEALIADAFAMFRRALSHAGLERVPTCHNLPMGQSATPLDPARLGKVVECLGMDYYHVAADSSSDAILQRTTEVVTRADAFDYPAFAVELAAGFPPFFPPLTEQDNRFAALSCLAAGIRGFNLYMAVERDRWLGSPIDRFGGERPSFDFWRSLNQAVERTRLHSLARAADVCIVVPRSLHRLERLLHAFGPISAAAFDIMGLSAYDSCLEHGPFASALFDAERFLRRLLSELSDRGLAYRVTGNDSATHALEASRFGFVVSAVGLEPELWAALTDVASRGTQLCFGPTLPTWAPSGLEALSTASPAASANIKALSELELSNELHMLAERHAAFRLAAGPGLKLSSFRDQAGHARVLFVTNTTREARVARIELAQLNPAAVAGALAGETEGAARERETAETAKPASTTAAVDALDGADFRATFGALEVPLSPHSVRMLELK